MLLDRSPAQLKIQAQYQTFVFRPLDQEQIMQIVVFVAMFIGAVWFFLRNIKPFLVLFATVRSAIIFKMLITVDLLHAAWIHFCSTP